MIKANYCFVNLNSIQSNARFNQNTTRENTHSVSNMIGKTNLSTYIFNDEIVRRLTLALACWRRAHARRQR